MIFRRFFCFFIVSIVFAASALAADVQNPEDFGNDAYDSQPIGAPADYIFQQFDDVYQLDDTWELQGIDVYAMSPVSSSTGLKGVLIDVIGPYDTIITQYTYRQNTSTNLTYINDISPDYPWLCSAALFVVLIFCVFRTLGGLLAWKK